MQSSESVKAFYENNTRRFLRWGGGRNAGVIHREVWGPGVKTRAEAFNYTHKLILDRLPQIEGRPIRVLDLGCGVGSSLFYLAERYDGNFEGVGVTISPSQVAEARERAGRRNLSEACTFVETDFSDLPEMGQFDVVYSIEAFVHAPDAERYFEQVVKVLKPGGKLFIVDDVRLIDEGNEYLRRLEEGWQLGSLYGEEQLQKLVEYVGMTMKGKIDLTDGLNLGRLRDRLIKVLISMTSIGDSPYLKSLNGGDALQVCLQKKWVGYFFLEMHT